MELTHISLFTGIGGIDIAAEWAGFETVLFVENNDHCQKVLKKHWPDVPIIGDIKDVTKEGIMAYAESWESRQQEAWNRRQDTSRGSEEKPLARNTKSNRGKEVTGISQRQDSDSRRVCGTDRRPSGSISKSPITLISGGFPCQPVSQAGKRKGKEDDRWLWPEMLRVISAVRPTWVVAENVAGLLNMGFNDCVSDLESEGYEVQSFLIPACAVNAPHRRDRIFIVGNSKRDGYQNGHQEARGEVGQGKQGGVCQSEGTGDVADTKSNRMEGSQCTKQKGTQRIISYRCSKDASNTKKQSQRESANQENTITGSRDTRQEPGGGDWWAVEPELGRVAHGIPSRVDRLRCLGNAVVPQQIYPILKAIADIELNSRIKGE